MFVCICNKIDDKQITAAAASGAETAEAAIVALGAEPICSHCLDFAQTLIDDHRAKSGESSA